jgi:hypothetical protein
MSVEIGKAAKSNLLTLLTAEKLATNTIGLYKNEVEIDQNTALADLTVADFSGYAAKTDIVFNQPFYDEDGKVSAVGELCQFDATAATIANVVYGYYVLDSDSALVGIEAFDEPKSVSSTNDSVVVVPKISL